MARLSRSVAQAATCTGESSAERGRPTAAGLLVALRALRHPRGHLRRPVRTVRCASHGSEVPAHAPHPSHTKAHAARRPAAAVPVEELRKQLPAASDAPAVACDMQTAAPLGAAWRGAAQATMPDGMLSRIRYRTGGGRSARPACGTWASAGMVSHARTHERTHARTHAACAYEHARTRTQTHAQMRVSVQARTRARTHTHAHTRDAVRTRASSAGRGSCGSARRAHCEASPAGI
jgi:hypothetical protein